MIIFLQRGLTHGRQQEAEVDKAKRQVDKVKEQMDLVADKLRGHNDGLESFKNQVEKMAPANKPPSGWLIINIGSIAGEAGKGEESVYAATKWGLKRLEPQQL
ncbi:hypothetical protein ABBQ38_004700 [Trebouxia sp. C0009 RCD-2024]